MLDGRKLFRLFGLCFLWGPKSAETDGKLIPHFWSTDPMSVLSVQTFPFSDLSVSFDEQNKFVISSAEGALSDHRSGRCLTFKQEIFPLFSRRIFAYLADRPMETTGKLQINRKVPRPSGPPATVKTMEELVASTTKEIFVSAQR